MSHRWPYWRRIIAATVAGIVMGAVFSGTAFTGRVRDIADSLFIALVFSVCIGPLLGIVMPRVSPFIWGRAPFPVDWVLALGVMIVVAMAGSALAIAVLTLVGRAPAAQFWQLYRGTLRISIVITLVFGVMMTSYELMRTRVERASAEAQLASLESRVQPHFLFNTLNSIAALIHEDPPGAERMTGQLASLLRSSLDTQAALVTVDEELRMVSTYLEIERVRFGERLRHSIHIGDGAAHALVPRFAIQTIVENSVKFAAAPRRGGASIDVSASVRDGRLTVIVADDGPGFTRAAIVEGHGLALLRDRLRVLFGDRAVLNVEATARGMNVGFSTPVRREDRAERG